MKRLHAGDVALPDTPLVVRIIAETGPEGELASFRFVIGIGEAEAFRPLPGHQPLIFGREALDVLDAVGLNEVQASEQILKIFAPEAPGG